MKVFKMIFRISFVFYLLALVFILFFSSRHFFWPDLSLIEYIRYSSNFVPFKTINVYIKALFDGSMNIDIPIKNLLGNFILMAPMGIYLPFFIKRLNKVTLFISCMCIILFIVELLQLISRRGSFDIDDFILNISGALIGFGIWKSKIVQKLMN